MNSSGIRKHIYVLTGSSDTDIWLFWKIQLCNHKKLFPKLTNKFEFSCVISVMVNWIKFLRIMYKSLFPNTRQIASHIFVCMRFTNESLNHFNSALFQVRFSYNSIKVNAFVNNTFLSNKKNPLVLSKP